MNPWKMEEELKKVLPKKFIKKNNTLTKTLQKDNNRKYRIKIKISQLNLEIKKLPIEKLRILQRDHLQKVQFFKIKKIKPIVGKCWLNIMHIVAGNATGKFSCPAIIVWIF
jgi:hypothetical protein